MAETQAKGSRNVLKLIGWVIMLVAVLDLIADIMSFALPTGAYNFDKLASYSNADSAQWTMLILVILCIISFVVMIFVGAKAVIVANGGRKSKFADFCVWVAIIVGVIDLALTIYFLISGTVGFMDSHFITQICGLILMILYIVETKKVVAANATQA